MNTKTFIRSALSLIIACVVSAGIVSCDNNGQKAFEKGEVCFEEGSYEEAVEWYKEAAEQGNADAQYKLGYCYANGGYEVPLESQDSLGYSYEKGMGVDQDWEKAVEWLRKAAEQGHIEAQYKLADCYFCGRGVAMDDAEAVKWLRKAAEQGHLEAQYNLGECYYEGDGVLIDYDEAAKWWRKAAEQGDTDAAERYNDLMRKKKK